MRPGISLSTRTSAVASSLREDGAAVVGVDVEGDALLVAVEVDEEAGLFGVGDVAGEGAEAARVVARRRLDLDDLRAEVGEQLRAVRPGDAL